MQSATHPLPQSFLNPYYAMRTVRLPYIYSPSLAIKKWTRTLWESLKGEGKIAHSTIVKPFPVAVDGEISTREEAYEALKKIEKRNGRFYVDEIGWWWDAYELEMSQRHARYNRTQ